MKVLQITAFSGWGCTGRIAVGIHEALIKEKHESAIAWGRINTANDGVETIQIGSTIDQNFHGLYTRLTDKCGFGSKRATEKFLGEIERYSPDLIQLHIMHGYYINLEILFTYIKNKNIPVVWTFHDCWAFTGHCPYFDLVACEKWKTGCHHCQQKKHHPTSLLIDNSAWNWKKKKELFTDIKNLTVVTPSKWLAGLVKESFLKECPVVVINNGINLNDFKPTNSNIRKNYGLEKKKIVLGVSSSWSECKGLDVFIQIAGKLPADYQIILVGLNKNQLNSLPKNIIGIQKTDSVTELAGFYSEANVFVNPTYEDNYPTTNLEAIACGTPVITYETGGSVEAVIESHFGSIVPQRNIDALLKEIITLSTREKMDCNNLDWLDQNLKFLEYVDLYKKILGDKDI
ncbi:glycosyltransferase [Mediterraneibacter glycyrrhizinilyticus]|uniref:glycosyltransferase n=1 Tax=Mediterraneibacter glycyrrhizinilyticus TaxID=342942 RepID=UPI0025A33AAB|nr:glycosyltransferase [Mediterraneibacter glycyrrhizinilyticus]MDM8209867.1 glycosyltransferase [Mediterraneibacter glycyrrhizinilyticus]